MICYQVCVLNTYHHYFDYLAEDGVTPLLGARVWVPFRQQTKLGVVVGVTSERTLTRPLKKITTIVDETPLISAEMLDLAFWIRDYYQSPLSEVLALMLPKRHRLAKEIRAEYEPEKALSTLSSPLPLNNEQQEALNTLRQYLNTYRCFLLYGVTGSGKTEVYLQLIANVLANGQQVLVLVPEIGLTPQLIQRFTARFHQKIAVIHSHVTDTKRQQAWTLAQQNQVQLVIGTRSAVFTPMPKLGLIVIDEEHDLSLKQMDGVRYSARDTALIRAYRANIPIVLGSATPSLETLHNSQTGKYHLLRLNCKAISDVPLHYHIVDIRNQRLQQGLSSTALALMDEQLQLGNQVLVFINRRGYSPVLLCHGCGWMADCHACDTHLTLHREDNRLVCHHCGVTRLIHKGCPKCHSTDLVPIGSGTQRIDEYLRSYFPSTSVLRVDRDSVSRKKAMHECLSQIQSGKAQLIVGTQMLAKGHHFPRLTLVVVLDTDNGFHNQDFRALEHLGQLLTQVSGRAGREAQPGQVVIQTYLPQHPLLSILVQQGYESFAKTLLTMRQQAMLPPYAYLAMFRAQSKHQQKLLEFMQKIKQTLTSAPLMVLGPAPAPLARKAGYHRMQLLLKASSRRLLANELMTLRAFLNESKPISGIRWNIDVDPVDLS